MNEREKEYYEKFKSTEISNEDIKKGEAKAKIDQLLRKYF